MIGKQPKPTEKRLEKLKWEYLKESPKYKRFCDWFHKKYIKEHIHGGHRLLARAKFGDIDRFDKRLPKEFHPVQDDHDKRVNPIINTYCIYGDIYNLDFDDFWKKEIKSRTMTKESQKRQRVNHGGHHPARDYLDSIEYDTRDAIKLYNDNNGIESKPSLGDLKPYFENMWNRRNVKILMIDCEWTDIKEIKEAVGHVLHNCLAKHKPEIKALKRYLDVLRKSKMEKDKKNIFNITRSPVQHYEFKTRAVNRDLKYARQIVTNLENGSTPWWKIG